jgi:hypothetical protein
MVVRKNDEDIGFAAEHQPLVHRHCSRRKQVRIKISTNIQFKKYSPISGLCNLERLLFAAICQPPPLLTCR